jgi:hypothetical protein
LAIVGAGEPGSAIVGNPVLIAGSDGVNAMTLVTDPSGRLAMVGTTASGTGLNGSNPVLIAGSDGTNVRNLSTDASGRQVMVGASATGAALAGNPVLMAGSDGTNARNLSTDASGRQVMVGAGATGAALSGNPVLIAGSDGTNARNLKTDTSGQLYIIPSNPFRTHCQRGMANYNLWCALLVSGGTLYDASGLGAKNVPLPTLAGFSLVSSTAGVQIVEVTYIGAGYVEAMEEVTLSGTTPKAMTNQAYCINGLKFKSGYSYTASQRIDCYLTTDSAFVVARMDTVVHVINGTFMCPANSKAVLTSFHAHASSSAADFYCYVISSGRRHQALRYPLILNPVYFQADCNVGLGVVLSAGEMAVWAVSANLNTYVQATWSIQPA